MQKIDLSKVMYDIGSKVFLIDRFEYNNPFDKEKPDIRYCVAGKYRVEFIQFGVDTFSYKINGAPLPIKPSLLFPTYKEALLACEKLTNEVNGKPKQLVN